MDHVYSSALSSFLSSSQTSRFVTFISTVRRQKLNSSKKTVACQHMGGQMNGWMEKQLMLTLDSFSVSM